MPAAWWSQVRFDRLDEDQGGFWFVRGDDVRTVRTTVRNLEPRRMSLIPDDWFRIPESIGFDQRLDRPDHHDRMHRSTGILPSEVACG